MDCVFTQKTIIRKYVSIPSLNFKINIIQYNTNKNTKNPLTPLQYKVICYYKKI